MSNPKFSALLIHGLTATDSAVQPLANFLTERGGVCVTPLLPGHGTDIEDLRRTTRHAWIETLERSVASLGAHPLPRFVIGESLGSMLACYLAMKEPTGFQGVVAISPPMLFRSRHTEHLLSLMSFLPEPMLRFLWLREKAQRSTKQYAYNYESYTHHHVGALARLVKIRRELLAGRQISTHALILQDPSDSHLDPNASALLSQRFVTAERHELDGASHQMLLGKRAHECFDLIYAFITKRLTEHA